MSWGITGISLLLSPSVNSPLRLRARKGLLLKLLFDLGGPSSPLVSLASLGLGGAASSLGLVAGTAGGADFCNLSVVTSSALSSVVVVRSKCWRSLISSLSLATRVSLWAIVVGNMIAS